MALRLGTPGVYRVRMSRRPNVARRGTCGPWFSFPRQSRQLLSLDGALDRPFGMTVALRAARLESAPPEPIWDAPPLDPGSAASGSVYWQLIPTVAFRRVTIPSSLGRGSKGRWTRRAGLLVLGSGTSALVAVDGTMRMFDARGYGSRSALDDGGRFLIVPEIHGKRHPRSFLRVVDLSSLDISSAEVQDSRLADLVGAWGGRVYFADEDWPIAAVAVLAEQPLPPVPALSAKRHVQLDPLTGTLLRFDKLGAILTAPDGSVERVEADPPARLNTRRQQPVFLRTWRGRIWRGTTHLVLRPRPRGINAAHICIALQGPGE